ncbi:MAG TPA: DUF262 domain-containing protein [Blastocatellia bacterium]|nr:DUF262 domain-containing protein [Blastocatellia bacterium]
MVEAVNGLQEKEDIEVIDEAASDDSTVPPVQYDITSYGADYDVEGLVKRLDRGDILIPPFQRNYIWTQQEASRFIESLLLGLPVPAIFLAREPDTNKLLVIDGQQRLKTLQFFYSGIFNPKDDDKKQQIFKLTKVQRKFEGLTYKTLEEQDKIKLNDSLIHAIIVKQESPQDNNTSVYHIFDRLNSEGRRLTPQEIRTAIDHGNFIDLIKELNEYENWRNIYGKKSSRLKDQELILRFLAFYFSSGEYEKPMHEFLNKFSQKHRKADDKFLTESRKVFISTIDVVQQSIGKKAFRPTAGINAAVFDSVMVGIARRLNKTPDKMPIEDYDRVKKAYDELLSDPEYIRLVSQSTSDESNVSSRLEKTTEKFGSI